MQRIPRWIAIPATLLALTILPGCEIEPSTEQQLDEAAEQVQEAGGAVGDELQESAESIEEGVSPENRQRVSEQVEEGFEQTGEAIGDAAEQAGEEVDEALDETPDDPSPEN